MTENTKPAEHSRENEGESRDPAQSILDFGSAMTRTDHGTIY